VGLEQGPLSLVSTTEELLDRTSGGFGLETEIMAIGIHHADYETLLYPQKLALTSQTSRSRSVGIVCSQTQVMEFMQHL
jgi:hypothetical protein